MTRLVQTEPPDEGNCDVETFWARVCDRPIVHILRLVTTTPETPVLSLVGVAQKTPRHVDCYFGISQQPLTLEFPSRKARPSYIPYTSHSVRSSDIGEALSNSGYSNIRKQLQRRNGSGKARRGIPATFTSASAAVTVGSPRKEAAVVALEAPGGFSFHSSEAWNPI